MIVGVSRGLIGYTCDVWMAKRKLPWSELQTEQQGATCDRCGTYTKGPKGWGCSFGRGVKAESEQVGERLKLSSYVSSTLRDGFETKPLKWA